MAKYTNSELCLIWLDSLCLDYKHKKEIYNLINGKDGIKDFLIKNRESIAVMLGENEYQRLLASANSSYFSFVTDGLERRGITVVTIESKKYPEILKETPFAPLVLYTKGNIDLFNSPCFAMVGSRKSIPLSIRLAENFAKTLSNGGLTLVTGIAEGVDETVLKSALECSGKVISVLGGGFDSIYPAKNKELVEQIIKKGLVITEYTPEVKAQPHHFPIRNRIIAGLSKGTLVVSGRVRSGTQYTANYAVEYSRDLFAIPYSVGVESGTGCNELIKKGAMLCDNPEEILSNYHLEKKVEPKISLDGNQTKIVKALSEGEKHVQEICKILNKQIYEVVPIISILEMMGIVGKNGVNVYGLTKNVLEE